MRIRQTRNGEWQPEKHEVSSQEDAGRKSPAETTPGTIYILGTGSVGKLVAHALVGTPCQSTVRLLFHREDRLEEWYRQGCSIEVIRDGLPDVRRKIRAEFAKSPKDLPFFARKKQRTIYLLVVAVKGPETLSAISRVAYRLTRYSTILFLQNGMGILDELNEKVFTNPLTRPHYMLGIISHGVYSNSRFSVTHAGTGTIALGTVPRYPSKWSERTNPNQNVLRPRTSQFLLRTFTRTPALSATIFEYSELAQLQLEKLVVNCVINPLTAILDCKNGELLASDGVTRIMRILVSEISLVIRSLPELQSTPNIQSRFSAAEMEELTVRMAKMTALNYSSMCQDLRAGKSTEIDYITGYIVRRSKEVGIKCVMNEFLMRMVNEKLHMDMVQLSKQVTFLLDNQDDSKAESE